MFVFLLLFLHFSRFFPPHVRFFYFMLQIVTINVRFQHIHREPQSYIVPTCFHVNSHYFTRASTVSPSVLSISTSLLSLLPPLVQTVCQSRVCWVRLFCWVADGHFATFPKENVRQSDEHRYVRLGDLLLSFWYGLISDVEFHCYFFLRQAHVLAQALQSSSKSFLNCLFLRIISEYNRFGA